MTPIVEALGIAPETHQRWLAELAAPHRHYHTLAHIEAMERQYERLGDDPDIRAAIWLHDIRYDPMRSDNEEVSAEIAAEDLAGTRLDIARVRRIILDTKHHQGGDPDTDQFADMDLSILGASAPAYQAYAALIRKEYAFVPLDQYVAGRTKILEAFDQRRIFKTPAYQDREAAAHVNLRGEIDLLRLWLANGE